MIYVNITSTFSSKRKTGIQRVVVTLSEFLSKNINYKFITYDNNSSEFKLISDYECISHAIYDDECKLLTLNFNELNQGDIFFDIDAAWSDGINRKFLYEILKRKGVKIYNFTHYRGFSWDLFLFLDKSAALAFPEFGVHAVFREECFVGAVLDDFSIV